MIVIPAPPTMPAPVREVVAGGAISNAIDWFVAKFFETVWAGAYAGAFSAVAFAILFVAVGYLLGRAQK